MVEVIDFSAYRAARKLDLSEFADYQHQLDFWQRGIDEWAEEFERALDRGQRYDGIPEAIA